jgi:hypothetical protein
MWKTTPPHSYRGVSPYLWGSFKHRMTEEACCEKMEKFSPPSTCDTPSGKAVPDEYLKGVSVPGPVHSIACCRRMNKCYLKAKTQRKRRAMGSDTEFSQHCKMWRSFRRTRQETNLHLAGFSITRNFVSTAFNYCGEPVSFSEYSSAALPLWALTVVVCTASNCCTWAPQIRLDQSIHNLNTDMPRVHSMNR